MHATCVARDTTHLHLGRAEKRAARGKAGQRVKCNQSASNSRDVEQEGNFHVRDAFSPQLGSPVPAPVRASRSFRGSRCTITTRSPSLSLSLLPPFLSRCNALSYSFSPSPAPSFSYFRVFDRKSNMRHRIRQEWGWKFTCAYVSVKFSSFPFFRILFGLRSVTRARYLPSAIFVCLTVQNTPQNFHCHKHIMIRYYT